MYIEQISTIHSEVPLLNISNIFKRYISIKNSNQQTSKRITLLRLKKTGEVYVYIYIYIILIKIYIYIFILLKIYKYTYTRWYTRTGTHTYIYIYNITRFRRAAIRTDRQTHMPMLLTRWIRFIAAGDDRRCLPVLDDLIPLNLRVVATLKSTSNGCRRNLCASACACVCVCTCTVRDRIYMFEISCMCIYINVIYI